tara:strand:- start:927 stop:2210 length:1284 start_codon:yes stop_codon:yes gene_type:complete
MHSYAKRFRYFAVMALSFCAHNAFAQWEQITPENEVVVSVPGGGEKTVYPSCSLPALPGPEGLAPNPFSFYFEQGESDNLLIYFNGGGACWDSATCLASMQLEFDDNPMSRATYNPSAVIENTPFISGGIFEDTQENPFQTWSKVFIPYCTGDLHLGSKDTQYVDELGIVTGLPGAEVTLKHRGHDNALVVMQWIKEKLNNDDFSPNKVLLSGSSAGGYGATFNFPYFQSLFGRTKVALFADASLGVISRGFTQTVLNYQGPWGIEDTLPRNFQSLIGNFNHLTLNKQVMLRLAYQYPWNRFAQYSTGTDIVQIQFSKISDQVSRGNLDPTTWGVTESDLGYILGWQLQANASLHALSAFTWNYQFYLGEGTCHMVLNDFCEDNAFPVSSPSPFYNEQSARGISFNEWLHTFATSRRFRENSAAYYH